ncbi:alpha/beta-hydrolase [Xylariomycetidae sp. FL2044]|nr:alpha/beta-hydrolase [Xylariomycetidae sp. FL2044]
MKLSSYVSALLPPKAEGRRRRALAAVRPWHVYASLGAVVVLVVVLAAVLTVEGDRQRGREKDQNTPSDPSKARVNLGYAQYRGSFVGREDGVAQYLGMRFAAPPVGDLRFRAPVEPKRRSGDQHANKFGPICLGISVPYPTAGQDEDCLYANVWAPANATLNSSLPVWLFIQGGGYTANANANWNGTEVVERSGGNIVFVNFNYRVGLWGFLASERLRADGDLNVGLLDQRFMMRWVKENIAQFGGDSDHVVIHGASAGAGSVGMHLIAHGGEDEKLFVGGIGESVFFPAQPFVSDLEWQFDSVLSQTGCDGKEDPVACLRDQDTETLQGVINVPSAFPGRPANPLPLFYWTPCVDGDLLRDLPYLMYQRGDFIDVPIIMGVTTDEGSVFSPNATTAEYMGLFLQNNYPRLSGNDTEDILDHYPVMGSLPSRAVWFPSTQMAYGEATFICPAVHILDAYAARHRNASRAWGYRYDVYDEENFRQGLGVPHLWTSWAVLGADSIGGPGTAPASYYTYNAPVVPLVMDYWLSFVRTLDPSSMKNADAPPWRRWGVSDGQSRLRMETGNFTMESVPADQRGRCEFWGGLAPTMQQ